MGRQAGRELPIVFAIHLLMNTCNGANESRSRAHLRRPQTSSRTQRPASPGINMPRRPLCSSNTGQLRLHRRTPPRAPCACRCCPASGQLAGSAPATGTPSVRIRSGRLSHVIVVLFARRHRQRWSRSRCRCGVRGAGSAHRLRGRLQGVWQIRR